MEHPEPRGPGRGELGVVLADGRGDDDGVDALEVGRVVPHRDGRAGGPQRREHRGVGGVGAADPHAAGQQQPRDGGHAGAADADEVHGPERVPGGDGGREVEARVGDGHGVSAPARPR